MLSTLDVARWLVIERGFSIIPVDHPDATLETDPKRKGKIPSLAWKPYQSRRPTLDELTHWFGNGVPHNLAIVTGAVSAIVVVDADDAAAEAWAASELPPTPMMTKTSRGTHHRFYRHPGTPVRNRARLALGAERLKLDVRADGGYVVGPTSQHASGAIYTRVGEWPPVPELPVFDPAWIARPAPTTLVAEIDGRVLAEAVTSTLPHPRPPRREDPASVTARARQYLAAADPAIEGQGGDHQTFRLACVLVKDFGFDNANALTLLSEWNQRCQPPWSGPELEAKIQNARAYGSHPEGEKRDTPPPHEIRPDAPPPAGPRAVLDDFTDVGNTHFFVRRYTETLRYDHQIGAWRIWRKSHWALDDDSVVGDLAERAMRARKHDALQLPDTDAQEKAVREQALRWATASHARAKIENVLYLARSSRVLATSGKTWDANLDAVACPNGLIDLRTGAIRPATREDGCTMQLAVPFDPTARCPRWLTFLDEVFEAKQDVIDFVQVAAGYSLTGRTDEQVIFLPYGSGANGKTTLLMTLRRLFGSYGHTTSYATFELEARAQIPADVAALHGKRFVLASESNEATRLNEARVKAVTGGDAISACFKFRDYFEFTPVCKVWLSTNHKPIVRDSSYGFWRRVRLIPFLRRFEKSKTLPETLWQEAAGILAWAVAGAVAYYAVGLPDVDVIRDATDAYERDSDPLAEFLEECVEEVEASSVVSFADLYSRYRRWAEGRGYSERSKEWLSWRKCADQMMKRYRSDRELETRHRVYRGIALLPESGTSWK